MSQTERPQTINMREDVSSIRRMALLLKPYANRMILSVLLLVVLAGVNMLTPAFLGLLFNDVFPSGNWTLLWLILLGIVVVYVARNLIYFSAKYTAVAVGENVSFSLRNRLFEHLQQMKLRFYREHKAGKISSRLMDDSFVIQSFIQDDMPTLLQATALFFFLIAGIYATNWQLALASTVVLPLHLYAFFRFKRPIKQASRAAQEQLSIVHGNLIEKFVGAEVVKGFTGEERENEAFVKAIDITRRSRLESSKYHVTQKVVADLLVGLGTIALLGFGAFQVLKKSNPMQPGTFIMFFGYVGMLYPTVLELMSGFAKMTRATVSVDRVFEMLESGGVETQEEGTSYKPIRGHLRFAGVNFSYEDGTHVLRDISLEVKPGQVCAIVGPSGSGKSTMVSLVPRFNEPSTGSVELDGLDVQQIELRHLREHIGIAFQECFLFNSSILENLRYARSDATMRQIVEVAKRTGAHDFISRLPDGYNTIVGESGITLSRGEKQRITLTRAMLKAPKILILDEATASIDQASESQIIPAILDFMRGKTTLMITHRPELLRHADLVVHLKDGRVQFNGPPSEFPMERFTGIISSEVAQAHGESSSDVGPPRMRYEAEHDDESTGDRSKGGIWPHLGMILLAAMLGIGAISGSSPVHAQNAKPAKQETATADPRLEGRLIAQSSLTDVQIEELVKVVVASARAQLGYRSATASQQKLLPDAPRGVKHVVVLARPDYRGLHLIQLGHVLSQGDKASQVWVLGQVHNKGKPVQPNDEVDVFVRMITASAKTIEGSKAAAVSPKPKPAPKKDAPKKDDAPKVKAPPVPVHPTGKFLPMPGLNTIEAVDLLDVVVARLQAEYGYSTSTLDADSGAVPELKDFYSTRILARNDADGISLIQLAYKTFRSQPLHIWLYGSRLPVKGGIVPNADMAKIEKLLNDAKASLREQNKAMTVADLKSEVIKLSYIEPDRCVAILKTLGFQTIEYKSGGKGPAGHEVWNPSNPIDATKLPIVMAVPGSNATALVGERGKSTAAFGLSMTPSLPSNLPNHTAAAPLMELMVLYHPAHPEQFAQLLDRIRESIDVPARQILIEAMVLEISEIGLDKLGVEWELQSPGNNINTAIFGQLPSFDTGESPALDIEFGNIFGEFLVRIEALVRDGEAEILSRPSVLTLDNRQASIRVGEEIPVATGASGLRGGDRLEFKFQYIPIGILLNVRPRTSSDGEDVSMQIDGIVSAEVPGQDLILVDSSDNVLARAPRISTRRVQTYSRVSNNTPFIIGGLVAKDNTREEDKVPILGDLPLIGAAFRSSSVDTLKREVIIVITPYVLPDNQLAGRNLPKDEDMFDSFNNRLFRDAYRIRAEDVFDLAFLTENMQLQQMRVLANEVISKNADFAEMYPFNRFAGSNIPGERILVYRQMYEVLKRRDVDEKVRVDKLIFFKPDEDSEAGFSVKFLWGELLKLSGSTEQAVRDAEFEPNMAGVFGLLEQKGKAIAMTWRIERFERDASSILSQPVPDVRLVDCPDRRTWSHLLWELNQVGDDGKPRFSVVLQSPRDIVRLKRATVLKDTVKLNAKTSTLTLDNFSIGRQLLVPTVKPEKVYLVDEETAKYFFYTEQYYPALRQEIDRDSEALRNMLKDVSIQRLLDDPTSVDQPVRWEPLSR